VIRFKYHFGVTIPFFFLQCAVYPPVKPVKIRDGFQGNQAIATGLWNVNEVNTDTQVSTNQNKPLLLDWSMYAGYGLSSLYSQIGIKIVPIFISSQLDYYLNPINKGIYSAGIGFSFGYSLYDVYFINGVKIRTTFLALGFGYNKRFRDDFQFREITRDSLYQTWLQFEYPLTEKLVLLSTISYSRPFTPGTHMVSTRGHNFPDYPLQLTSVYVMALTMALHAYAF